MSPGRHYRWLARLYCCRCWQKPFVLLPLMLLRRNSWNELEVCTWTGVVAALPTPHQSVTNKHTAFTQSERQYPTEKSGPPPTSNSWVPDLPPDVSFRERASCPQQVGSFASGAKITRNATTRVPTTLQNSFSLTFPDKMNNFPWLISLFVTPVKQY